MKKITALAASALLSACGPATSPRNEAEGASTAAPTTANEVETTGQGDRNKTAGWAARIRDTEQGFVVGNPDATHKLIEYGSRTCPACARFGREGMETLLSGYVAKGDLSYEFRDFLVHGAPDLAAALVGTCGDVSRRLDILEANFADQERSVTNIQNTPQSEIKALEGANAERVLTHLAVRGGYLEQAARFGMNDGEARACLADTRRIAALTAITNEADPKVVTGTPTFILDGKRVDAHDWAGVRRALNGVSSPR